MLPTAGMAQRNERQGSASPSDTGDAAVQAGPGDMVLVGSGSTSARPESARPEPRPEGPSYELEQLRELLFGAIQRDIERRLARVDLHASTRASGTQEESRRRTDLLETHLRREIEAIGARVEQEIVETGKAIRALTREHRETLTALEQRIAKIEEAQLRGHRELRDRILDQAKSTLDELRRVREDVAVTLERELGAEGAPEEHRANAADRHSPH